MTPYTKEDEAERARQDALYADEPWAKLAVKAGFRPWDTESSARRAFEYCAGLIEEARREGWEACLAACEVALLEACTTGEGDDDDAYCSGWMQGAAHQNRADAQAIRSLTPPDMGDIIGGEDE